MKKVNILSLDFLREWLALHFSGARVWIPLPSIEAYDGVCITVVDIYYARFLVSEVPYVIILVEEQELKQLKSGKLKLTQKVRVEVGTSSPYILETYDTDSLLEGYSVKMPPEEPQLCVSVKATNESFDSISFGPKKVERQWLAEALMWFESLARVFMNQLKAGTIKIT